MERIVLTFLLLTASTGSLDKGTEALSSFRAEEAIAHLLQAQKEGPYGFEDYVRLYEQLGIAYTYLDQREDALAAFDMLLALDPAHAISYTLSPKVTFIFEQARRLASHRLPPTVYISWPRELRVTDSIPVDVEVVSDPKGFLKKAKLHQRKKDEGDFQAIDMELPPAGQYKRVLLPAVVIEATQAQTIQLFLTAYDERDNQVFRLGWQQPREISLGYEEETPWYGKWWVWAIVGGVIAAGTGTAVYLLTYEQPNTIGGTFRTP